MVLLSRNKKTFKSVSIFFVISIITAVLFLVLSYQFEKENLLEFSIIFRFISLFFLIISALFGFSLGQISVRLYRDKTHKHTEEDNGNSKVNHLKTDHLYVNQNPSENQKEQFMKTETVTSINKSSEQKIDNVVHCNECNKEIYNPYQCKQCSFYFCNDHLLAGDHSCSNL